MTSGWSWWKAPWAVFKSPQTVPDIQAGCADDVIQDKALARGEVDALNSAPSVGRKSFSFPTFKSRRDRSRTSRSLPSSRKSTTAITDSKRGSPTSTSHNTMAAEKSWILVPCGLARTEELRRLLVVPEHMKVKRQETTIDPESELHRPDINQISLFEEKGYSDTAYIRILHKAFGPELERLKKASPTVESSSVVKAGILEGNLTPSQLIYDGQRYPEVERTLTGMLVLKWILTGDYDAMTCNQNAVVKLPKSDFEELKERFESDLRSPTEVYSLMVAMIINDLGKDDRFMRDMQKIMPKSNEKMNHDEVIYRAAKKQKIELLEEFNPSHVKEKIGLSEADKKQCEEDYASLLAGLQLGATLNLGQLCQAENVPGCLKVLRDDELKGHRHTVNLKFLEIVLDVAGAQGHIDSTGSQAWVKPANEAYKRTREALKLATQADPQLTLRYSYDHILRSRFVLIWPDKKDTVEESLKNPETRALVRLITIGRAMSAKAAAPFTTAFERFKSSHPEFFKQLIHGMDVDGDTDGVAIIPYYAPGTIAEIKRICIEYHPIKDGMTVAEKTTITRTQGETLLICLEQFYILLAKVYRGTSKQLKPSRNKVVECSLEFLQKIIRAEDFPKRPETLGNCEVPLEAYSLDPAFWYDPEPEKKK